MTRAKVRSKLLASTFVWLVTGAATGCSDAGLVGGDGDGDGDSLSRGVGGSGDPNMPGGTGGTSANPSGGNSGVVDGAGGSAIVPVTTNVCATVDEEGTATLTCPDGGTITSIAFASYGTPTGECGGLSTSDACHAADSQGIVEGLCLGQTSCSVEATNEVFAGDPCSFVPKHLSIEAVCTSDGTPAGTGGAPGSGGESGAGGTPGTGGAAPVTGDLTIFDPVPGFASVAGGTTGGGTNLAQAVVVDTMDELSDAAEQSGARIILVEPGTYSGTLSPSANKTIVGLGPGVMIRGNVDISGSDVSNVIMRNIAVRGNTCGSYDECRAGADAVYIGSGAHHVWLDHMDISDGQDGNCDMTQEADYITVSWSRFYYTYDKEHRFSNLIAGGDGETNSAGKLRITYMNSWWGERVDSRQPRGRFGNIHMLNNYHNTGGGQIHGVGFDMALIAENSVYDEDISIFTDMGSPRGWKGVGNIGSGDNLSASQGSVFTIPYAYTAMPANQVVDAVTSDDCGSGNTCTFAYE